MPGLGFTAPAVIPDPRHSDEAAKSFLNVWGAWAGAQETLISQWASTLDDMIKMQAATCEDVDQYNRAALSLFAEQSLMRIRLIKAGVGSDEIDLPPFPVLFAAQVNVTQPAPGSFNLAYTLPCAMKDQKFVGDLDYSQLKTFGPPQRTGATAAMTPFPSPTGFGALPVVVATWAGRALLAGILLWGTVEVIGAFRKLFSNEEIARIQAQIRSTSVEQDKNRADFVKTCFEQSIEVLPRPVSPEALKQVRAECHGQGQVVFPPREEPDVTGPSGFETFLIIAGAGALVAGGVFALRRLSARKRGA
jgi:hypothetical protein